VLADHAGITVVLLVIAVLPLLGLVIALGLPSDEEETGPR
jgi:hypothetical protein